MIKKESNLMMLLLIGSEALFFVSLIMGYVYFWRSADDKEMVKASLDIRSTAIYTVVLALSSFTLWLADHFYKRKQTEKLKLWLIVTILLGMVFLWGQGSEYYRLLYKTNITLSSSLFGTTFYTLTGFHGLHVVFGLIILLIILLLSIKGFFNKETSVLRTVSLYWHFVDVVWLAVFTVIYIIPYL